jgi:hypothetical protein
MVIVAGLITCGARSIQTRVRSIFTFPSSPEYLVDGCTSEDCQDVRAVLTRRNNFLEAENAQFRGQLRRKNAKIAALKQELSRVQSKVASLEATSRRRADDGILSLRRQRSATSSIATLDPAAEAEDDASVVDFSTSVRAARYGANMAAHPRSWSSSPASTAVNTRYRGAEIL